MEIVSSACLNVITGTQGKNSILPKIGRSSMKRFGLCIQDNPLSTM